MSIIVIDQITKFEREYHADYKLVELPNSVGLNPDQLTEDNIVPGGIPKEKFLELRNTPGVEDLTCFCDHITVKVDKSRSWKYIEPFILDSLKQAFLYTMFGIEVIR